MKKTDHQDRDLEKHLNRIDDQGDSLIKGSIPWLLHEALLNIYRLEDYLGPNYNRIPKKELKPIVRDLRDQLVELRGRLD